MRTLPIAALGLLLAEPAWADEEVRIAPELGGVLVVSTSTKNQDDLRFGAIAGGFAKKGHESFVAADMLRPPPDAELQLVRARRFLDDARRYRRRQKLRLAAQAGNSAVQIFQRCANEPQHLDLLVQALSERGAAAVALEDTAKAETVFLAAISLDPVYQLDDVLFDDETRRLFGEVRRASRQLKYGSIRVDVPGIDGAIVSIDFSAPRDPPYAGKLPDGRHFVSVTAPGRYEVVALIAIRAGRQTQVSIRPPLSGDVSARAEALSSFDPARGSTAVQLAKAVGLRFVAVTELGRSNVKVELFDGKTGLPVPGAAVTLSVKPRPAEINAAVDQMLTQAKLLAPAMEDGPDEGSWYTSWWAISLLGLAVAGGAAATVYLVTSGDETEYRFEQ